MLTCDPKGVAIFNLRVMILAILAIFATDQYKNNDLYFMRKLKFHFQNPGSFASLG